MELFKLWGSILVDNDEANKSISKTGKETESLSSKLGAGIKQAGKFALGISTMAAGAGAAMFAMTNKVVGNFDEIAKNSTKLGITTSAYQEMSYWAGQNGISTNDFERAVGRLNQRIGLAAEGNDKYAGALERLGVDMDAVKNGTVSTEDAMAQSIQTLSQMTNEQEKSALASELFGTKLARELMPALQSGSLSMEEAKQKAQDLGLVVEEDTLRAAEAFGDTWDDLTSSLGVFGQKIIAELMPVFQAMMDWVMANMPTIQAIFQSVFNVIGVVFSTAKSWIEQFVTTIQSWVSNNESSLKELWEFYKSYLGLVKDYVNTIFNAIKTIIKTVLDLVVPFVKEKLEDIKQFWDENGKQIMQAVENAFNFIKKIIETVMPIVKRTIEYTWSQIKTAFDTAIGVIMGLVKVFSSLLTGDFEGVKQGLISIWESLWNGIKGIVGNAWNLLSEVFSGLWDSISGWFTGITSDALGWGKDLIRGFFEGIKSMGAWLGDKISNFISKFVPGPVKSVLGIASPSKVMMEYGEDTAEGLALGMESQGSRVGQAASRLANSIVDPVALGIVPNTSQNTHNVKHGDTYNFAPGAITLDVSKMKDISNVVELMKNLKQTAVTY